MFNLLAGIVRDVANALIGYAFSMAINYFAAFIR